MSANQKDWAKLLDVAQFAHNLRRSESTGKSPFELIMGQQPLTPSAIASGHTGNNPTTFRVAQGWQDHHELARSSLHKAAKRMKKWVDKKRRDVDYNVEDKVGKLAYELEMPPTITSHPVFHVSLLKPSKEDTEEPNRGKSKRAPFGQFHSYDREDEEILSHRLPSKGKVGLEYLVKWKGLSKSETSWEPQKSMWQFEDQIKEYHDLLAATRASPT
ncbi:uncharacterized protein [Rutidosis leptorrhynchoides]|uniref:uncharacterized protein n=1 Tax=Rutidosis leptorrhynchoides TaxID=125765 RepID=UPI003A99F6F7